MRWVRTESISSEFAGENGPEQARGAVFIVDKDGIVKYAQIVPEVASEPNYEDVLNALRALI